MISDIVSERSHVNNEKEEYKKLRQTYLDYYDFQRYNENLSDLLTIQRGSDDMSLLTEIVTKKSNAKLFSVPQAYETDEAGNLRNSLSRGEKVPS